MWYLPYLTLPYLVGRCLAVHLLFFSNVLFFLIYFVYFLFFFIHVGYQLLFMIRDQSVNMYDLCTYSYIVDIRTISLSPAASPVCVS